MIWRGGSFVLASSVIPDLLNALGMNDRFVRWLTVLIHNGEIPMEQKPLLKEHLDTAKVEKVEELVTRLVLPFERRFGEQSRRYRQRHSPWEW
jgi:hypothetical protein